MRKELPTILIIVSILYLTSCTVLIASSFNDDTITDGNVAVIPINGVISFSSSNPFVSGFDYSYVKSAIREAESNPKYKAIVLSINSPGGTPVASDDIGLLIKNAKKPTVAWIREVGASGAYWIASNADYIVANRMSMTGSIGVYASYLEFSGLMDDYNVTYQSLNGGQYKDLGSPYKKLSADEEVLLQNKIDLIHEFFIEEVKTNRKLIDVKRIESGEFFLGVEAKELGLVDELGGEEEVIAYLKSQGIEAEFAVFDRKPSFSEIFSSVMQKDFINLNPGINLR